MTIGERLEDARKRKGISIREVAEATKIRGDFLMAMEDNSMDIPLPEIYKRGFLKNYANFLKIDANKILTDYTALQSGAESAHRDRNSGHEEREVFGRMALRDDKPPEASSGGGEPHKGGTRQEPPPRPGPILTDNTLYLKIAAGLMGAVLVIFIVFVIVNLLRSGDDPAAAADGTTPTTSVVEAAPATSSTAPQTPLAATGPSTIVIRASENVTIIIDDLVTRERLFSGLLRAGDTQLIEREGTVNIKFSNGSAIEIQLGDGSVVRPTSPGMGQTQL